MVKHYVKQIEGPSGEWNQYEFHLEPEKSLDFSRSDYRILRELDSQSFDCDSTFRVIDSVNFK